ncbi:hypothetical protein [Streptomyces sp. NPDC007094]|uniref:hypothetical protein n=1 Tax=Streptomyces sp. NPDC007094 TaxID=3155359 RepID=UPI0033E05102
MSRIPDAVSVVSLDTHRLIVAVPHEGPANVASTLPRSVAADMLRRLADHLVSPAGRCETALITGRPCPVHDAPGNRPADVDDPLDHLAAQFAAQAATPEPGPAPAPDGELTADVVRDALAFNDDDRDQVLATLRDVLLNTSLSRTPDQALAAARILLTVHAHQIAALVEAQRSSTRTRAGLTRSTRGLLTGYEVARKIVTAYATGLADDQALAEAADREQAPQ